jgi:hypothetical protein
VYKISKKILDDIGINTNTIDPRKISLFGSGGRMLPLSNSNYYPNDLTENAISVIGKKMVNSMRKIISCFMAKESKIGIQKARLT